MDFVTESRSFMGGSFCVVQKFNREYSIRNIYVFISGILTTIVLSLVGYEIATHTPRLKIRQ